jgi:hypothetical protein
LKQPNDPDILLLNIGNTNEYAVGFARQKRVALHLDPSNDDESSDSSSDATSYPTTTSCFTPDHAARLFQKRDSYKWNVLDCLSIVDLKLSDTTCGVFQINWGKVGAADLMQNHSALAKTILYSLECVLPFHARRGVLGNHLPLALLAGKKKDPVYEPITETEQEVLDTEKQTKLLDETPEVLQDKANKLQWVSGRLEVPLACGDRFYFNVQDFGPFCDDGGEEEEICARQAASLYLETLLFGLTAALSVQSNFASDGPLRPAVPASGQFLKIDGKTILNLSFCSSPIPGANVVSHDRKSSNWKTSQGELFKGRLSVNDLFPKKTSSVLLFFDTKLSHEGDVVVKVSSIAVHKLLVAPVKAWIALRTIRHSRKYALLKEIRSVLKAAVETTGGQVTIMDDLSKQGYEILQPIDHPGDLHALWGGFQKFVKTVLIPLADLGIVHPDIRPGYDLTSNILCKLEGNGDRGGQKATMKLIDYESLLHFIQWTPPFDDDRYIRRGIDWEAETFVWWQCLGVAYSWKEKITGDQFREGGGMEKLQDFVLTSVGDGPVWLEKFKDVATGTINANNIKAVLQDLANELV